MHTNKSTAVVWWAFKSRNCSLRLLEGSPACTLASLFSFSWFSCLFNACAKSKFSHRLFCTRITAGLVILKRNSVVKNSIPMMLYLTSFSYFKTSNTRSTKSRKSVRDFKVCLSSSKEKRTRSSKRFLTIRKSHFRPRFPWLVCRQAILAPLPAKEDTW